MEPRVMQNTIDHFASTHLQQHEEYHSTMTQAKIATSSNWEK
jgi:hypothetical protein